MGADDGSRKPERRATVGSVPEAAGRLGAIGSATMARTAGRPSRLRFVQVVHGAIPNGTGLGRLLQQGVTTFRAAHQHSAKLLGARAGEGTPIPSGTPRTVRLHAGIRGVPEGAGGCLHQGPSSKGKQ